MATITFGRKNFDTAEIFIPGSQPGSEIKENKMNQNSELNLDSSDDSRTLQAVWQFLKKHNLKATEEQLMKEANIPKDLLQAIPKDDVHQALAAYKSDGDPKSYEALYRSLKSFVDSALDLNKVELNQILYPVFVQMYLELVYNGHEQQAIDFFEQFSDYQEVYYATDLARLRTVTKTEHMQGHELMEYFRTSTFGVKMSRESYSQLKRYMAEHQLTKLMTFVQEKIYVDVFDGAPRSKDQIDALSGSMAGEAMREANKMKVYYGLLKEPDINIPLDDEEESQEEDKPSKKKKAKKDPFLLKKAKNDPNSPQVTRIPLPEVKDQEKLDKIVQYREAMKRVKLRPDCLPSVCFYTFLNSFQSVNCIDVTEDSTMMAAGFSDSAVRLWSLTERKLRMLKSGKELDLIDKDADDVLERMMDDRSATDTKLLVGHCGPVFGVNFSHDRQSMVSSSEDGTVRLWNLMTQSNLVAYKGHNFPVWDCKFAPYGHYFASCGHDRTARLWSTDSHLPVRIFVGHISDVECIEFHHNSNYLATGSSDRSVRLWDVLNGGCVRQLTGHKSPIQSLCFSPDGRYLASGSEDGAILLWDIANGNQIAQLKSHRDVVHSLCFSREGAILASGGMDECVSLWDVNRIFDEQDSEGIVNVVSSTNETQNYLLETFSTKSTPILNLHFTRRNMLLAAGPYTMPT